MLRGPLFVQPADSTDDYTDSPPLVRLLDGDAVLTAWAAERLVARPARRSDPRRLRAAGRAADPGPSFTVSLGGATAPGASAAARAWWPPS